MQAVVDELHRRWRHMFAALARGEDLPPGRRLRAEGMMEALVLAGGATELDLQRAMDDCHAEAFGEPLAAAFGDDWQTVFPFPQIPAMARRAPVYPSTKE